MEGASQKSEDNLATAEAELEKQTGVNQDLTKKLDELHAKTEEAARLKDQVDEYGILSSFFGTYSNVQVKVTACCGQTTEDRERHGEVQEKTPRRRRSSPAAQGLLLAARSESDPLQRSI